MQKAETIHLGGEQTVTGSCHLLQCRNLNILVDCGVVQGRDSSLPIQNWPVPPKNIDYLFLTHAHIDHIGRLPELISNGFSGEIICSSPTKALLAPMLSDAMQLSGYDKSQSRKILAAIEDQSWDFEYNRLFALKKGIEFKLGRAGHILGSCFFTFIIPDGHTVNKNYTIIFSGDLGNHETPILCDPDQPDPCDLLILESTYGNRLHEARSDRLQRLSEVIEQALRDGGKIFVPAFSLGRTQEFLYELDRLYGDAPPAPVFVDSPLGSKITEIYSSLAKFWDKEARRLLAAGNHPFDFENLYSTAHYRQHQQLLDIPGPSIIIAGSGMCSGGRILDHLASGLDDPVNDVFFIGYQAQGTLGRNIIKYGNNANGYVNIDMRKVPVRAKVHKLTGYSAHADQKGLVDWVESMQKKPGKIKLVHGELNARKALAAVLKTKGHVVDDQ